MEERAFSTIIQSVTPVGKEFQNPGGGKSTIISHSHTGLYYQRGRSLIRFRYRDQFDVLRNFQGKMVTSTDFTEIQTVRF